MEFQTIMSDYEFMDEKDISNIIINYYKKYLNNKKNCLFENSIDIDYNSPFFDALSNSDIFGKLFNLVIPSKTIKKFDLKNEFISKFKKLNEKKLIILQ